ncbi:hypothetical protein [Maritalea myrionectae]|nr:hypothetical protein [Maritalea myrionectae]
MMVNTTPFNQFTNGIDQHNLNEKQINDLFRSQFGNAVHKICDSIKINGTLRYENASNCKPEFICAALQLITDCESSNLSVMNDEGSQGTVQIGRWQFKWRIEKDAQSKHDVSDNVAKLLPANSINRQLIISLPTMH